MATYEEIVKEFFFLRHPRGHKSFEAFEAEDGAEDREATEKLLKLMLQEAPVSATNIFHIDYFPLTLESISILDEHLDPNVAERLIRASNPDDEENPFKLTVCELSVHLGTVLAQELGGGWRYARFPNYFQSKLYLGTVEVSVFDMIMKKCSTDLANERIGDKVQAITSLVLANRRQTGVRPN